MFRKALLVSIEEKFEIPKTFKTFLTVHFTNSRDFFFFPESIYYSTYGKLKNQM
jgi:hypothetical protein